MLIQGPFLTIKSLVKSAPYSIVCLSNLCFLISFSSSQIQSHQSQLKCFLVLCVFSPWSDFAANSHMSHLNQNGFTGLLKVFNNMLSLLLNVICPMSSLIYMLAARKRCAQFGGITKWNLSRLDNMFNLEKGPTCKSTKF